MFLYLPEAHDSSEESLTYLQSRQFQQPQNEISCKSFSFLRVFNVRLWFESGKRHALRRGRRVPILYVAEGSKHHFYKYQFSGLKFLIILHRPHKFWRMLQANGKTFTKKKTKKEISVFRRKNKQKSQFYGNQVHSYSNLKDRLISRLLIGNIIETNQLSNFHIIHLGILFFIFIKYMDAPQAESRLVRWQPNAN